MPKSAGEGKKDQRRGRISAGVRLGELAGLRVHLLAKLPMPHYGLAPLPHQHFKLRLLFEIDQAYRELSAVVPDSPGLVRLSQCYHNLLRRWTV